MVDLISPATRSRLMSRIRFRNTGPEMALRQALWAAGLRYRLKVKQKLPGKPDVIFAGAKVVVFVDGCFWHSCPKHGHRPKSREEYWYPKLTRNQERDAAVNAALREMGWQVIRFWEHQIRESLPDCVTQVAAAINKIRDVQKMQNG